MVLYQLVLTFQSVKEVPLCLLKMKMKAIDQYNSERLVVYQDRNNNNNRTLDMFQSFYSTLGS